MDVCYVLGIIVIIYYSIYFFLICILDCDINLAFYEYFGKSLAKLQTKVVWVTGASSGIGEAMAYEVAKSGGIVVLSARRTDLLERVKARCLELNESLANDDVLVLPMDVTDLASHQICFNTIIAKYGHIDILINNAGRSQRAKWEDINVEVDRQIFELNVFAVVALSRLVVRHFNERGKGRIAVTSSVAGVIGAPMSGSYTGTKHAIHGYFNALRMEKLGTNISVTLLCPGPTFSSFLQESFTAEADKKYGISQTSTDRRMKTDRCAKLCLIAIVNKLDEAWMALFPVIPIVYAILYFPNLARVVAKYGGARRLNSIRDSRPINT